MDEKFAIVGFGEAGRAFAQGWAIGAELLRAYDVAVHDEERAPGMHAAFAVLSVTGVQSIREAVAGAKAVFCLVPTDQAVAAAEAVGPHFDLGAIWLDGSSSAPGTKRRASEIVEEGRGHYVDMAIMAPVHPRLHRTPVLLSGNRAETAEAVARSLGMDARVVGGSVGDASTVKMLRSVIVKGIEALSAECFLAARRAGVEALVLESLGASDPQSDWPKRAIYNLGRMTEHGTRRAAEMREVTKTLDDLGIPNWMASGTASWQDRIAGLSSPKGNDLTASLDNLLADFG